MSIETFTFFPPMYPDEDFRSIIYRYRARQNTNQRNTRSNDVSLLMKELFNLTTSRIPIVPHNLAYFCSKFPENLVTVNQIISKHTFFPLELSFSNEKKSKQLFNNMNRFNSINGAFKGGEFVSSEVYYCPKCLAEDLIHFGEGFIHRVHQIKFIDVCAKHNVRLISRCPECNEFIVTARGRFDIHFAECRFGHDLRNNITEINKSNKIDELKLEIAEDIQFILNNHQYFHPDNLRSIYNGLYLENDFYTANGKVRNNEFIYKFFSQYSLEILEAFGIAEYNVSNYLSQSLVDYKIDLKNPVILKIMTMKMFRGTAENFVKTNFSTLKSSIPFGHGPWFCPKQCLSQRWSKSNN